MPRAQKLPHTESTAAPSAPPRVAETVAPPVPVQLPGILRRAEFDVGSLAPSEILTLQRTIGNQTVARLLAGASRPALNRRRRGQQVQRAWGDADTGTYAAPKEPGQPATPAGGWNAANQTVGVVERIPLEGLTQGLQASTTRSAQETADEKSKATQESENGKAIAVVPTSLKPGQPVEVFLHLHGHNLGYRERSAAGEGKGMEAGSVRDVAADRIEQQLGASGRNMIGILPQGTQESGFGAFNPDAYITEVWGRLVAMGKLPKDAKRGPVVLSGHSGAAAPITQMLRTGNLPTGLGELVLFDAIHGGQRPAVEDFLKTRMEADVKALKDIADPSHNGGLDAAGVLAQQTTYLAGSFRFRGIFTPKYHPQKVDEHGNLMWQDEPDPKKKKKPVIDESVWKGYGVEYEPLRDFIKAWIDGHTKGLDSSLVTALRENYKVTPAGPGATHNTILSANDNLQSALSALPGTSTPPTPNPPAQKPKPPKTGALEPAPSGDFPTEMASNGGSPAVSTGETAIQAKRWPLLTNPGRVTVVQRQPAPGGPATDAEQWDQDWTAHAAQQNYFAGSDRPAGTPRQRYDVLCPLYKAHGIARPMVYMAGSITTARFYGFSTPAHTDLSTALATAEGTLKGKGYAAAPVTSVWALNPRTTSTGGWSNHADGKAVDLDPDSNPHLVDKQERKIITEVTGTDMDAGGQGYDVMKGASDKFQADYNPAGLQRRITELKAAEKAKETERDTAKAEHDTLKGQRDTIKSEIGDLKKQLKDVPHGKTATPDDATKATALKNSIQQKQADQKQVEQEIKQKEADIKKKEAELKQATKDRELMEKELTKFEATEKAISDLENSVQSLPDEIKSLDDQIAQSKQDEQDAKSANNPAGVQAQQKLRAKLQQASTQKKAELKKKQTELDKKKKKRDADPLRKYAAGGFLNLSKDVVDAMTGAGLKWGGNWTDAKDFMHFEL